MKRSGKNVHFVAADADRSLEPVRARARQTRAALLNAGRALLETHDFQAMSIAAIAAANGMSVGSFYGRFKDKEAFFESLQNEITAEWIEQATQALESDACQALTATEIVNRISKLVVRLIRQDAGFLRAALKHEASNPAGWTPIKQAGKDVATLAIKVLRPAMQRGACTSSNAQIQFALQVLYSTCFNGILHDPGPIPIASPRLERELARIMCLYLDLPVGSPKGAARPSSGRTTKV